jgi:FKBP-type peptidyl-prolyl cis-trans isomerase FkpA
MKKHLLILTFVLAVFASCKKEVKFDASAQAAKDETAIQAYLAANPSIHATKDPSGVYYFNLADGTGANPKATSTVTVNYVGKLLNDSQFDAGTGFAANLSGNIIEGWKTGLLHGKVGGRILLIIPSGLAYGNFSPDAKVPANSVLVFTIDVQSITN